MIVRVQKRGVTSFAEEAWAIGQSHEAGPPVPEVYGVGQVGTEAMGMGVFAALSQGFLVGPIVKRLGERRSILLGLTVSMLAFLAYTLAPAGWMIYLVIVLSSFGAVDEPASQALVSSSVGEDEQGAVQGALASLLSFTAVIGPLIGTSAFRAFVSEHALIYFPGAPFALGAVLIAVALLLAWRFVRPAEHSVEANEVGSVQGAGD